jgi:hypothetical protein
MYFKGISESLYSAAAFNVSHHLDKLVKDQKVNTIEVNETIKYSIK